MELTMEEKTIPEIICALLRDADMTPFMPEVWRDGCGAVFLTGEVKRETFCQSVGFELAVRCGETAGERGAAIRCLSKIEEYFAARDVRSDGVRGYIVPTHGIKQVRSEKNGMAEYRAAYSLICEHSDGESAYLYYINTGSKESPVWSIVGDGFFLFDEKTVGEIFSRRYFHENMTRSDVSELSSEISYEIRRASEAAAAVRLREISEALPLWEDSAVEILTVLCGEDKNYPGAPVAVLREYEVLPSSFSKERGLLTVVGKLLTRGDGRDGRFVMSTGIFVPKE